MFDDPSEVLRRAYEAALAYRREVADRFYAMDRGAVTISGPIASLTDEVVKVHLQV